MTLSDKEIRRKYSLPESVPVRHAMPSPEEMQSEPSSLTRLAEAFGYESWMWKSAPGKILAVIVLAPAISGAVEWWYPKVEVAYKYAQPYIQVVAKAGLELGTEMIGFVDKMKQSDSEVFAFNASRTILVPRTLQPSPLNQPFGSPFSSDVTLPTSQPPSQKWLDELLTGDPFSGPINFYNATLWRIISMHRLGRRQILPVHLPFDTPWEPAYTRTMLAAPDLIGALAQPPPINFASKDGRFGVLRISVSGEVRTLNRGILPTDYLTIASGGFIKEIIALWLGAFPTLLLRIPSMFFPSEFSYIINLDHPDAEEIKIDTPLVMGG